MNKTCSRCGEEKPLSEFHRKHDSRDGLHTKCKPCNAADARAWDERNRDQARATRRAWKDRNREAVNAMNRDSARRNYKPGSSTARARRRWYGLSPEEYEAMYDRQMGECLICHTFYEVLCVDHDHETGRIRGLLCRRCNAGLGQFRDDPTLLAVALQYLAGES